MKNKAFNIIEFEGKPTLELNDGSILDKIGDGTWSLSLQKWELLYQLCDCGNLVHDGGRGSCALCRIYFWGHGDECEECPIMRAGFMGCDNTPHQEYSESEKEGNINLAKKASLDEIMFLRSFNMGLDNSYLLYFKKDHLLNALQGLEEISSVINPPIKDCFTGYSSAIKLEPNTSANILIDPDLKKIDFATVLKFNKDEAILEYRSYQELDEIDRSPPDEDHDQVTIGFIYLTIYLDVSERVSEFNNANDLVLFEFGTTGTKMSMLFSESTSIRETFTRLLENNQGICGEYSLENDWPILFWLKGKRYSKNTSAEYKMLEEFQEGLKKSK